MEVLPECVPISAFPPSFLVFFSFSFSMQNADSEGVGMQSHESTLIRVYQSTAIVDISSTVCDTCMQHVSPKLVIVTCQGLTETLSC
jgi:hypothetical protein